MINNTFSYSPLLCVWYSAWFARSRACFVSSPRVFQWIQALNTSIHYIFKCITIEISIRPFCPVVTRDAYEPEGVSLDPGPKHFYSLYI